MGVSPTAARSSTAATISSEIWARRARHAKRRLCLFCSARGARAYAALSTPQASISGHVGVAIL